MHICRLYIIIFAVLLKRKPSIKILLAIWKHLLFLKNDPKAILEFLLRLSFSVIGSFSPVCPSLTGRKICQYMNVTEDVYKNFQDHRRLYKSRNKLPEELRFSGRILRIIPWFHKGKQKLFGLFVSPSKNTHIVTQLLFRSVSWC